MGSGSHCGVEFGRRCHAVPKWVYSSGRLFFVSVRTNKRHHHHHHHHHHPVHVSAQKNPSTGGIGETQAPTQREREGGCGKLVGRGEERERSTRHQVNNLQQCGVAVGNARHAAIFSFLLVQIFADRRSKSLSAAPPCLCPANIRGGRGSATFATRKMEGKLQMACSFVRAEEAWRRPAGARLRAAATRLAKRGGWPI